MMTNRKLWTITSLSLTLGLLIAWGVVRLLPCETRVYGEPTPAPWPTILEQDDNDDETKAVAVDMASDQTPDTSAQ